MPDQLPATGRHKDTTRDLRRSDVGKSQDWLFPKTAYREVEDRPGHLICPSCHAISTQKRWFLDEAKYEALRDQADTQKVQCPGCERIERGVYEGRVVLSGDWLLEHKDQIINLVKNQETEARQTNPFSRIGAIKDNGKEIEIFVTTQWLAERLGKELRKSQKGTLQIDHLPQERFSLVKWHRDKAA